MQKTCAEGNWTELVLEWRSQRKSLAQLSWHMGLPATSAGNALNCCFYSCKTTVVHKLYDINYEGRVYFVN